MNYGLSEKSVISGVITGNSVNGISGTKLGDISINTETGAELLGHHVSVYTNGKSGAEQSVYYISDDSRTVVLKEPTSDNAAFSAVFGKVTAVSVNAAAYDETFAYLGNRIEGLDSTAGTAPAGTYIIYDNYIISYCA